MLNYQQFMRRCRQNAALIHHQGTEYLNYHAARFYETYKVCRRLLRGKQAVLSIGAGSAYIEGVLAQDLGLSVTVIDFPEAVKKNQAYYDKLGWQSLAIDLDSEDANSRLRDLQESFDLAISGEIVEHIPDAPSNHYKLIGPLIKKNGYMVTSTPNLGSIVHIAKLLLMQPLLDPAEETFAPVSYENEGIHRREYMPRELITAMYQAGLVHNATHYIWYHKPRNLTQMILYPIEYAVPRFRPAMIVVGKRDRLGTTSLN